MCQELKKTHIFFPVASEIVGSCNPQATERVQDVGRRISAITEDNRETTLLFQRLSSVRGSAKRKCGLILRHFPVSFDLPLQLFTPFVSFKPVALF